MEKDQQYIDDYNFLGTLPNNYQDALIIIMKKQKYTITKLSAESGISTKTISRHRDKNSGIAIRKRTVIQIIAGLKLREPIAKYLLEKSGYKLTNSKEDAILDYLLKEHYNEGIDFWNIELEKHNLPTLNNIYN